MLKAWCLACDAGRSALMEVIWGVGERGPVRFILFTAADLTGAESALRLLVGATRDDVNHSARVGGGRECATAGWWIPHQVLVDALGDAVFGDGQTIRDCPRVMSPAVKTPGTLVILSTGTRCSRSTIMGSLPHARRPTQDGQDGLPSKGGTASRPRALGQDNRIDRMVFSQTKQT